MLICTKVTKHQKYKDKGLMVRNTFLFFLHLSLYFCDYYNYIIGVARIIVVIHLHKLHQLLPKLGVVSHENGFSLSVNSRSTCPTSHLSIFCCLQQAVLCLQALIVMPEPHVVGLCLAKACKFPPPPVPQQCSGLVCLVLQPIQHHT